MTRCREINFDGLVGPSHNYGGLSFGNIASATNAGATSRPRRAARQGLAKMRRMMELGLIQGFLPPLRCPAVDTLRALGFTGSDDAVCAAAWAADPALLRNCLSASAMWTANAATISPAPDTHDGRCHLTVANLSTMAHRSFEPRHTLRTLETIFGHTGHFAVHAPVPACFGDEGAANHMRLCSTHGERGLEIFVYGETRQEGFPARQNRRASEGVARLHGLDSRHTVLARQSDRAIQAGAFHNDVVAVANETVLITHEHAFEEAAALYDRIAAQVPSATIIEVPAARVSLEDAVRSYLFNSQLVTLPGGGMALIVPSETQEIPSVRHWLEDEIAGGGPIVSVEVMDLRESMRNGGGPACLRLRVAASEEATAAVDQRFILDEAKWVALDRLVETWWPETIAPADLGHSDTWHALRAASDALAAHLGMPA